MRIEIREEGVVVAKDVRDAIEARCRLTFARIAHVVAGLRVTLRDSPRPGEGIDRNCTVDVLLRRGGEIHAAATAEQAITAVNHALDRAERAARRLTARQHAFRGRVVSSAPATLGAVRPPPATAR